MALRGLRSRVASRERGRCWGQAAEWEVVRHFPPLTLPQLRAQRKVLLSYSLQHPVRQAGTVPG